MIQRKACRFRLYPTPGQRQLLVQYAGACRFIYNLALEQRRDWYRPGRKFSYASQCRELTALRQEYDWLKAVPAQALQQALKDLDHAYRNWWAGRAAAPRPRRRSGDQGFRFPDPSHLDIKRTGRRSGMLKLPKIGWIRFRGWRPLPGQIRNVTITGLADGWYAAVQCERDVDAPQVENRSAIGIDLGVAVFAAMSDGRHVAPANAGRKTLKAMKRAQRALARKRRGSINRRKAVRRVARLHRRIVNIRCDFLHKISTSIAKSHGMVVMEALQVGNMSASAKGSVSQPGRRVRQKAGLNRAILDQGWSRFKALLRYKLIDRGGELIEVRPAYTSQTCAACGVVDAGSRRSQAVFACTGCGHEDNADVNAARNILRLGLEQRRMDNALQPVEGHRPERPAEAGTTRRAA